MLAIFTQNRDYIRQLAARSRGAPAVWARVASARTDERRLRGGDAVEARARPRRPRRRRRAQQRVQAHQRQAVALQRAARPAPSALAHISVAI